MKRAKTRKGPTVASLIKKLDRVFSKWVRMRGADEEGLVDCVTCGKVMHWKDAHACHFISRRHMSLRFDPQNVHPGCVRCNLFENGSLAEYSQYLLDEYGRDTFDRLLSEKHQIKKFTRDELQALISEYEQKVRDLEQAR